MWLHVKVVELIQQPSIDVHNFMFNGTDVNDTPEPYAQCPNLKGTAIMLILYVNFQYSLMLQYKS